MKSPLRPQNPLPFLLAAIGFLGSLLIFSQPSHSLFSLVLLVIFNSLGLINTVAALIPWHGKEYRHKGINRHLHLLLLPIAFIWCLTDIFIYLNGVSHVWLVFWILALGMISIINGTLISYALRDKDKLAPEFFQG